MDLCWPRITLKQVNIELLPGFAQNTQIGAGWNLHNPKNIYQTFRLFEDEVEPSESVEIPSDSLTNLAFVFDEINSYEREQEKMKAFLSAGYGPASGKLSISEIKKRVKENHIVYATLTFLGSSCSLLEVPKWSSNSPPKVIPSGDLNDRWEHFMETYGTHYCHDITYGLRFIIRASVSKKSSYEQSDFTAAVSATLGVWKGDASYSNSKEKELRDSKATFEAVFIGGGTSLAGKIITSMDAVKAFFAEVNSGALLLKTGPIVADLRYLKPTLATQHNDVYKALYSHSSSNAIVEPSLYGVPAGTVIAWWPRTRNIEFDDNGKPVRILPPEGWAFCDNDSDETLNLEKRFIRGAFDVNEIGEIGGQDSRTLEYSGQTSRPIGGGICIPQDGADHDPRMTAHSHEFNWSITEEFVPNYLGLCYIIKIDESHENHN